MPLYEYRCSSCGERVEVLQHVGDPPLTECRVCGGAMEKLLSAPALQFRGSGWYITDYARKGNGNGSARPGEGSADKAPAEAAKPAASDPAKSASGDAAKATSSSATTPTT